MAFATKDNLHAGATYLRSGNVHNSSTLEPLRVLFC